MGKCSVVTLMPIIKVSEKISDELSARTACPSSKQTAREILRRVDKRSGNRQAHHTRHGSQDVEQAIVAADSFDGFILELQNMGYTVKYGPRVEHMAVRHKNAQRNVRIDWLDPRFFQNRRCASITANCIVCPPKCSRSTDKKKRSRKTAMAAHRITTHGAAGAVSRQAAAPIFQSVRLYGLLLPLLRPAAESLPRQGYKALLFSAAGGFSAIQPLSAPDQIIMGNTILKRWMTLLAGKENAEVQIQQLARQRKIPYSPKSVSRNVLHGKKNQSINPAESPAP